jgi:UDP-glucose 4-epimerase
MNILITGVAGLLGSRLAEYLIKNKPGVTVVGVDDLSGGYTENVPKDVKLYRYDVGNTPNLDRVFDSYKFDVVYHFAAYAAECVSPFIRKYNYTNNLLNTANIVNLCIKYNVGRLVFTSSMSVYGEGVPPFDETQPRRPVDPYGIAKAACEMDIEVAYAQHGLDYCIIRPHNVYGRNQNLWDSYRNVLGIWMYKHLHGDPLTIFGDGLQTRAFSAMDDVLEPLWIAAISPHASRQIINLGGIEETSIKDAAGILTDVMGGGDIIYLPPRHEVKYAYPTYQKSVDILGFEHKTSLHDGLKDMWAWAQTQPKRERFIWKEYELDKGVYEYWKPDALKDGYWKPTEVR